MSAIKQAILNMLPKRRFPSRTIIVRLEPGSREPVTPVEHLALSMLTSIGAMPLHSLTERVATELYREEVRKGAGTLDIGLFGSRLFRNGVAREIESADGILWQIKQQRY